MRGVSHPPPLSIRANMLWNSSGSLIYLGSQWLITILVVRLAAGTYQDAGVLALGMTIMNIFAPLAEYRMSIYQVSDVKEENSVGEYLAFRIMTSSVALVAIIIYSFLTAPRNALVAIYLYCLTKILSQVIGVLHSQDQVHRRMDFIGRSLILQGLGTLGAFAAVFGATKNIALACERGASGRSGLTFGGPRLERSWLATHQSWRQRLLSQRRQPFLGSSLPRPKERPLWGFTLRSQRLQQSSRWGRPTSTRHS